jgi:cyanophycinase
MFRRFPLLAIFFVTALHFAAGQPPVPIVQAPCDEIRGTLVICGGGEIPDAVRDEFVKRAGGQKAKLVVIPTASAAADGANADKATEPWKKYKLASLTMLHTRDRNKADEVGFVKPLTEATAVWFGGGAQKKIADAYVGTLVEKELNNLLARDGVVGGTSAGAAVMSQVRLSRAIPWPRSARAWGS